MTEQYEYPVVVPHKLEPMMGSNLVERMEEFAKQRKAPPGANAETHRLSFAGEQMVLPIWVVPISLPRYRLENGRTLSAQIEWVSKHKEKGVEPDFFRRDPESIEAQYVQHTILKKMMVEAGLGELFKDDKIVQEDPLILDHHGYVVNGNRRLCLWRELFLTKPNLYPHFEHVRIVVLPERTPQAITKLEVNLQVRRNVRADYKWHALAHMYRENKRQLNITDDAIIADMWEVEPGNVTEHLDMLEVAERFLRSRDKAEQWSEVDGDLFAFKKLVAGLSKIKSAGDKRFFQVAAFNVIDREQKRGRSYDRVPEIAKYMPAIKRELEKTYPVKPEASSDPLLGGGATDISMPLAKAIDDPKTRENAAKIIVATIDEQKALELAKKDDDALLKLVGTANSNLTAAELEFNKKKKEGKKINTAGAVGQLDTIIEVATRLKGLLS